MTVMDMSFVNNKLLYHTAILSSEEYIQSRKNTSNLAIEYSVVILNIYFDILMNI